jgi:transcriptional regulator with XRE-family HTH domain
MDAGQTLQDLMRVKHLTQADVAEGAGVSQATVSRVLRRSPRRSGAAYLRVCTYIQQQQLDARDTPTEVFAAVRRVWDGSERHAAALTQLIDASQRLWPDLADAEERPSTAPPNFDLD